MTALLENAPRQSDVLRRVAELERAHRPVSASTLAQDLKLPRQSLRQYLLLLRDKGLIHYEARARQRASVSLTQAGHDLTQAGEGFPIIGEVAAGQPGHAEQHLLSHASLLSQVLDLRDGDFLLRVRGDSMSGAGIFEHDLVVIRPSREEPHRGEIVLVSIPLEQTTTLKRWERVDGQVSLRSDNPAYAPILLKAEAVQVQGRLIGHIGTGRARHSRQTQS